MTATDRIVKAPLTVLILTKQEELNIAQAIENTINWAQEVFVLDSESTDRTVDIASKLGAKVFTRQFDNYANQRNHAIKNLPINTSWVLFLDADEYLTEQLKNEISETLQNGTQFDGFYLKRRFYFMGKWIRFGGYYPTWLLRLFKRDKAICEREINEHIAVDGDVGKLKHDFVDDNKKDFSHWLDKHNKYSTFEASQFDKKHDGISNFWGSQAERKQWIRQKIWNSMMPPLIRPFIYFIYRYFIRLGFLDGKTGLIYHFMHGLVFLLIIDVKYLEIKKKQFNSLQ